MRGLNRKILRDSHRESSPTNASDEYPDDLWMREVLVGLRCFRTTTVRCLELEIVIRF